MPASSSEEKVLLELRPSPLIMSLSSGNFFVGSTFFLSTPPPFFLPFLLKLLLWKLWSPPVSLTLSELRREYCDKLSTAAAAWSMWLELETDLVKP